jgi:hypothetical protein
MCDKALFDGTMSVDAPAWSIYKPPVAGRYRSAIETNPISASAYSSLVAFALAF